jgi:peptidoglycan/xylan/chitin deacetylase (PgdA/CDA1 family)
MPLPGMKLAQYSFRRVRSRFLGGIVVLGYHRLGEGGDPFGLAVSRRHFAAHVDVVARRANPMRLSDAVRAAAEKTMPRRAVVVTFDDGYSDTYEEVLPLLERTGVPATVFVTTGCQGRQFWWDELATIVMEAETLPDTLETRIQGRTWSWTLSVARKKNGGSAAAVRRRLLMALADTLRVLQPEERDDIVHGVRTWAGRPSDSGSDRPRSLTAGEIRKLADSPYIEIGAHTVSHPVLSALTPGEQRREVQKSRTDLQTITGRPVASFSYPHGAHSAETRSIVAEAGFTIACCSTPDVITPRSHPLALPRLWVGDQDGGSFAGWLEGWLQG